MNKPILKNFSMLYLQIKNKVKSNSLALFFCGFLRLSIDKSSLLWYD